MAGKRTKKKRDIYQEVTDTILRYLEEGTAPWRNPIAKNSGDGWPKNLMTDKRYRGVNVLLLSMQSWASGYASDYWMTYKQASEKGGQVRKGEKGSLVTFWKMHETTDKKTGEETTMPILRHYTAFNVEQIDGVAIPDAPDVVSAEPFRPLDAADQIVAGYQHPPEISHDGGQRAFYRIQPDSVHLPAPERFDSGENYYSTLFHELSHSTGHSRRLDRGLDRVGSPDYSREELVAEISAAYLCATCGISPPTIEQSAAYLQGWIKVLKGDKRLVIAAAGAAQKSSDLILGEQFAATSNEAPATSSKAKELPTQSITPVTQMDLF